MLKVLIYFPDRALPHSRIFSRNPIQVYTRVCALLYPRAKVVEVADNAACSRTVREPTSDIAPVEEADDEANPGTASAGAENLLYEERVPHVPDLVWIRHWSAVFVEGLEPVVCIHLMECWSPLLLLRRRFALSWIRAKIEVIVQAKFFSV